MAWPLSPPLQGHHRSVCCWGVRYTFPTPQVLASVQSQNAPSSGGGGGAGCAHSHRLVNEEQEQVRVQSAATSHPLHGIAPTAHDELSGFPYSPCWLINPSLMLACGLHEPRCIPAVP